MSSDGTSRGRAAVRRLGRPLRAAVDLFPLTPLGALVALAGAGALSLYAYASLDLVLLVVGYVALGLVAGAVLLVLLTALVLRLRARRFSVAEDGRRELETGRFAPVGFELPSWSFVPLLQLGLAWVTPKGVEVLLAPGLGRRRELARFHRRGEHARVERRVLVQDAFGLARVGFALQDPRPVRVQPHLGGLMALPFLATLAAGDRVGHPFGHPEGDFIELRRYAPGDPARRIHWKIFGRTRRLMVRAPERALSEALRTAAYLVVGPGDDASAAAARAAVLSGALGPGFRFAADGSPDASTPEAALSAIVVSGAHLGDPAAGLEGFVARAEREGPVSLVVFAPPTPGPWLARVLAVAARRPGRARVVVGVDGVAKSPRWPLLRRVLLRPARESAASIGSLEEVLRALASARLEVHVVDRPSGRLLSSAHLKGVRRDRANARAA